METEFVPGTEPAEKGEQPKEIKNNKFKGIASKVGIGIAGAAGAIGLMSFMNPSDPNPDPEPGPKPVVPIPVDPEIATNVNDDMSFAEAFAAARNEVGAGGYFVWHNKPFNTYYKEEWDSMSPEQRQQASEGILQDYRNETDEQDIHPAVVVHDEAPVATHVTDDMSPNDAFVIARNEVGPGGVYVYQGQTYSTYLPEEVNAMSQQQQQDFENSTGATNVVHPPVDNSVDVIPIDVDSSETATASGSFEVIREEYIDDGQGGKLHIAMGLDESGEIVVKLDSDSNGTFDTLVQVDDQGNVFGFVTEDGTQIPIEDISVTDEARGDYVEQDLAYLQDDQSINDTYSQADYDNNADVSDMV